MNATLQKLNNETPAPQPIPITQHRQASIVALVAILFFGTAFLVVKIGFTSLVWVIASLAPILAGIWRYLVPELTTTSPHPTLFAMQK
ncbi:hypothetical protein [Chamaesiphon sp.]|uniref:hypothetical protein n=1 Tax=Chamaesiphon sp. TaxID=2814140 RepID=UPI0035946312